MKDNLVNKSGDLVNDTISRAAAIEALGEKPKGDDEWSSGCRSQWEWDTEILKTMPPAQPEIIRCKDCKQFRRWIDTDICFCDITESERLDNDFCSRAERRTDERSD